ncbi:cell wall anchor protein [Burkholderia semiarida]|uniref:cell wall anchor protein n=1 Tax=Burkholderia semiarida TaxID=2843303 RepID=UPI0023DDCD45|nr:cell wall anchor protein [Burkholderia semiarida]MDF3095092.1 cell wall anchor protein [Burkholderia semiarida]
MSGTVAFGNALASAAVTVTDASGKTVATTSGADGSYSIPLSGLTAPFVITATDPTGVTSTLYSIVASKATTNGAPVIANVTPLTTAVAAFLTTDGNPGTLAGNSSVIQPSVVSASVAKLDSALAKILSANGLSATSFDPIGGTFATNQTGADAVIDSVRVSPSATGTGLQLASLADPDAAIPLNRNTTVSTQLKAPSQPANYLAGLLTALGQCMAGTSSACTSAIDASYLNDGYGSMQNRHSGLFATGSTLTGVKTVAFLPANTLPAISSQAALVYFLFTGADGRPNFASDIVQQLPSGRWDIIGNQEQYNIYIASFLGRVQFTDSADAGNGRYEAGLNIHVPSRVTANGVSTPVGSARVQGPGLPANGMYLLNAASNAGDGAFNPYLTIPSTPLTAPWTGCSTCSQSNGTTTQYKWSWTSLSGGTFPSPATADYAAQQVDLTSVPQFSKYTVTLFDMSGAPIGQPQNVINVGPKVTAAAGPLVPWQTLGSDVIANFLTAGGSATTSALSSLKLDWTVPASSAAYPNFWTSIGAVQAAVVNNGVQIAPQEAYSVFDWGTQIANGSSYSETLTTQSGATLEGLNAEVSRNVQLGWNADGLYYTNTWQYSN